MQIDLTSEQFVNWKNSKETREVFKALLAEREFIKEDLARGISLVPNDTAMATARFVGIIFGLDLVLNIEMERDDAEERAKYGY